MVVVLLKSTHGRIQRVARVARKIPGESDVTEKPRSGFITWAEDIERVEENPFVIVGQKPGTHLVNLKSPWQRIRKKAELEDVRLHDLRHSFASIAVSGGMPLAMIGKLLGHTQPSTTARYAHLATDPVKRANELIGQRIADAMRGADDAGEIVEFPRNQN